MNWRMCRSPRKGCLDPGRPHDAGQGPRWWRRCSGAVKRSIRRGRGAGDVLRRQPHPLALRPACFFISSSISPPRRDLSGVQAAVTTGSGEYVLICDIRKERESPVGCGKHRIGIPSDHLPSHHISAYATINVREEDRATVVWLIDACKMIKDRILHIYPRAILTAIYSSFNMGAL